MFPGLAATALGLLSAISWGGGDFCGGLASKRSPVLGVILVGYLTGVPLFALAALLRGEAAPGGAVLAWSMAAGLSGTIGLAALYRGLAIGRMALVAPVSAVLAAAIPVVFGALTEGPPPALKVAGIALALAGIWLVARSGASGADRAGLLLALAAGAGFGAFFVLIHLGGREGTFWPLVAARTTAAALVLAAALLGGRPWRPVRRDLPLIALSGVLDAGGNAFFLLASQAGRLDAAAVLSSMYPAGTILLAALLLRERVSRPQGLGIAALLAATVLIAG